MEEKFAETIIYKKIFQASAPVEYLERENI
jgi:hypothetical protein